MQIPLTHPWDLSAKEAMALQLELQSQVICSDVFSDIRTVAGIDVGFEKKRNLGRAALVVLRLPKLEIIATTTAEDELRFPYVPGLLSFREIPVIMKAMEKLTIIPDLCICDGQGVAHPRRFGIACHLGVLLGIPTIGAGKSRLTGRHGPVPNARGAWTSLIDNGEIIGAVLRSRAKVKPIFVSAGHMISLESSIDLVMRCITRYRLPETTRAAHKLSQFSKT